MLLIAALGLAGTGAGAAAAPGDVLRALHAQDLSVEAVGFRLATSNAGLCPAGGWDPGFQVHTLEQYGPDYRIAARQLFGLGDRVGVMAVAPGSPAAAAGLRDGDELVAVDGAPLPQAGTPSRAADFSRTGEAQRRLREAFGPGAATLTIRRGGAPLDLTLRAAPACASLFQVVPDAEMNGAADGAYVQVSSDLVRLAGSDDELAALLAHELAHNILGHRSRLDALRVDRGLLAPFGRNARLIRQTEAEADLLGIDLVARAGYDPAKAIAFWDRLSRIAPTFGDPTHPAWSERLRAMRREADRIGAAGPPARDVPLPPALARLIERR